MKNVIELRQELINIFDDIKSQKIKGSDAKEMVNTAGKIIGTVKLQLEYAGLRKETPAIEFLSVQEGEAI